MPFKKGDVVFHARCGACVIETIGPLALSSDRTLYYGLRPLYGEETNNNLLVPFAHPTSLSAPLTKKEVKEILSHWPKPQDDHYIIDAKARRLAYETALRNGKILELAALLEGAAQRKAKAGKLNSMDAQFVLIASPLLYGELAYSLGIPYEEVADYILGHR